MTGIQNSVRHVKLHFSNMCLIIGSMCHNRYTKLHGKIALSQLQTFVFSCLLCGFWALKSFADNKNTQRGRIGALKKLLVYCGEVLRLLYCTFCASPPSLHRESTDSLIFKLNTSMFLSLNSMGA